MRALVAGLMMMVVAAGCSRRVEVGTGAPETAEVAVHVTNNLGQPVNVYVNDMFIGTVQPNSTGHLPVTGVASGATVNLRATTTTGTATNYTRNNVMLSGTYAWQVP
jgi:hypothetical protein